MVVGISEMVLAFKHLCSFESPIGLQLADLNLLGTSPTLRHVDVHLSVFANSERTVTLPMIQHIRCVGRSDDITALIRCLCAPALINLDIYATAPGLHALQQCFWTMCQASFSSHLRALSLDCSIVHGAVWDTLEDPITLSAFLPPSLFNLDHLESLAFEFPRTFPTRYYITTSDADIHTFAQALSVLPLRRLHMQGFAFYADPIPHAGSHDCSCACTPHLAVLRHFVAHCPNLDELVLREACTFSDLGLALVAHKRPPIADAHEHPPHVLGITTGLNRRQCGRIMDAVEVSEYLDVVFPSLMIGTMVGSTHIWDWKTNQRTT